ncbi:hypothetical protein J7T55_009805 [Diaporthe amygdali]|uniref:uncharacterized protein n=1 Tax=Phomopsis amygdali TaxID=1214568 RepID=UPI0022FEC4EB|nr:uncharacterized protein J7T55_009805 [Diaporthe amygdali]KAJ0116655.1 hypothetical protein J7T55_009805 [Diaporthe amygdali]
MGSKQAPRILLLKNYPSTSPVDHAMTESFRSNIKAFLPEAQLDVCGIANGETIPDPSSYELVILSGGYVNLLEDEQPKWVLDVLEMIRQIAGGNLQTKLLGICWGHQAIHRALGGRLAWVGEKHRNGVQDIQLSPAGQKFFHRNSLLLHKYHIRYVPELAPDFTTLSEDSEITLASLGKILTFQGQPELTCEISKTLIEKAGGTYERRDRSKLSRDGVVLDDISTPHDGSEVWGEILRWAV